MQLPASLRARVAGFYSRELADHILGRGRARWGKAQASRSSFAANSPSTWAGSSPILSRTVSTSSGVTERVSWDRTHVLSVVLGYYLGRGWRVRSRLFLESGRPFEAVCVEHCGSPGQSPILHAPPGNLPAFCRLDARLEKKWHFRGGRWLTASAECFNVFDRAEAGRLPRAWCCRYERAIDLEPSLVRSQ